MISMKKIAFTSSVAKSYSVYIRYIDYITEAAKRHGISVSPVILPALTDADILHDYISSFDGFLFTGGVDIEPSRYGELTHEKCGDISLPRDAHELLLLEGLRAADAPVFGICRGIQSMAVAAGCTLWQDIYAQKLGEGAEHFKTDENERHYHPVTLSGFLAEAAGEADVITNSYHHQAVKDVCGNIEICALSHDGLIEGINDTSRSFYRAVQWHPELDPDALSYKIITPFLDSL